MMSSGFSQINAVDLACKCYKQELKLSDLDSLIANDTNSNSLIGLKLYLSVVEGADYEKVLSQVSKRVEAIDHTYLEFALGVAEQARSNVEKAIEHYARSIELDVNSTNFLARIYMGEAYSIIGAFSEGDEAYRAALAMNHCSSYIRIAYAEFLAIHQKTILAMSVLNELDDDDVLVEKLRIEANILETDGDFIGARARYLQILSEDPTSVQARLGLGAIELEIGDRSNALAQLHKLYQEVPNHIDVRFQYGLALYMSQRYKEAKQILLPLLDYSQSVDLIAQIVIVQIELQEYQEAKDLLLKHIRGVSNAGLEAYYILVHALAGDSSDASAYYERYSKFYAESEIDFLDTLLSDYGIEL